MEMSGRELIAPSLGQGQWPHNNRVEGGAIGTDLWAGLDLCANGKLVEQSTKRVLDDTAENGTLHH